MAPTFTAPHLLQTMIWQGTARAFLLRIALLRVPSICASCTLCLVGRDQCMTRCFSIMPAEQISSSQRGSITLQMPDLPRQTRCLSLIEVCSTTWLNGSTPILHTPFIFLLYLTDISLSPQNSKELFNLRHSQAQNVIEQISEVIKWHF